MRRVIDPAAISRIIIVLLIGFIFLYVIYQMVQFGEGNTERQVTSIEAVINKALVQCYALEGSYPSDVEYVEKYGVIFDHTKYVYFYEWYGGNLRPSITVLEK